MFDFMPQLDPRDAFRRFNHPHYQQQYPTAAHHSHHNHNNHHSHHNHHNHHHHHRHPRSHPHPHPFHQLHTPNSYPYEEHPYHARQPLYNLASDSRQHSQPQRPSYRDLSDYYQGQHHQHARPSPHHDVFLFGEEESPEEQSPYHLYDEQAAYDDMESDEAEFEDASASDFVHRMFGYVEEPTGNRRCGARPQSRKPVAKAVKHGDSPQFGVPVQRPLPDNLKKSRALRTSTDSSRHQHPASSSENVPLEEVFGLFARALQEFGGAKPTRSDRATHSHDEGMDRIRRPAPSAEVSASPEPMSPFDAMAHCFNNLRTSERPTRPKKSKKTQEKKAPAVDLFDIDPTDGRVMVEEEDFEPPSSAANDVSEDIASQLAKAFQRRVGDIGCVRSAKKRKTSTEVGNAGTGSADAALPSETSSSTVNSTAKEESLAAFLQSIFNHSEVQSHISRDKDNTATESLKCPEVAPSPPPKKAATQIAQEKVSARSEKRKGKQPERSAPRTEEPAHFEHALKNGMESLVESLLDAQSAPQQSGPSQQSGSSRAVSNPPQETSPQVVQSASAQDAFGSDGVHFMYAPVPSETSRDEQSSAQGGWKLNSLHEVEAHLDAVVPQLLYHAQFGTNRKKSRAELEDTLMNTMLQLDQIQTSGLEEVRLERKRIIRKIDELLTAVDEWKMKSEKATPVPESKSESPVADYESQPETIAAVEHSAEEAPENVSEYPSDEEAAESADDDSRSVSSVSTKSSTASHFVDHVEEIEDEEDEVSPPRDGKHVRNASIQIEYSNSPILVPNEEYLKALEKDKTDGSDKTAEVPTTSAGPSSEVPETSMGESAVPSEAADTQAEVVEGPSVPTETPKEPETQSIHSTNSSATDKSWDLVSDDEEVEQDRNDDDERRKEENEAADAKSSEPEIRRRKNGRKHRSRRS